MKRQTADMRPAGAGRRAPALSLLGCWSAPGAAHPLATEGLGVLPAIHR